MGYANHFLEKDDGDIKRALCGRTSKGRTSSYFFTKDREQVSCGPCREILTYGRRLKKDERAHLVSRKPLVEQATWILLDRHREEFRTLVGDLEGPKRFRAPEPMTIDLKPPDTNKEATLTCWHCRGRLSLRSLLAVLGLQGLEGDALEMFKRESRRQRRSRQRIIARELDNLEDDLGYRQP